MSFLVKFQSDIMLHQRSLYLICGYSSHSVVTRGFLIFDFWCFQLYHGDQF